MLKILLVSDTHGNLTLANRLAEHLNADLIIHAGDFGFYNEHSIDHLTTKELKLRIVHSPFKHELSENMKREDFVSIIRTHGLLGDFPDFINKTAEFKVPLYAVWGNHDDHKVIEKIKNGLKIKNLHLLDENEQYIISDQNDSFLLYGLGGNFLMNQKAFSSTFQGEGGKIQSTFHQYGKLYQNRKNFNGPSIFVSHVSPGKEPILTKLISHFAPDFWVSGHMSSPFPTVWNQSAIRNVDEIKEWTSVLAEVNEGSKLSNETKLALDLIKAPFEKNLEWIRKTWNINLPDIEKGYALLNFNEGLFSLETFGNPGEIDGY